MVRDFEEKKIQVSIFERILTKNCKRNADISAQHKHVVASVHLIVKELAVVTTGGRMQLLAG